MALWLDKMNALDFAYQGYQYPLPPTWKYAVRLEDQIQWLLQAILKVCDRSVSDDELADLRNELYDFIDRVTANLEDEIEEYSKGRAYCYSPVDGFLRSMTITTRQLFDASRPFGMKYKDFDSTQLTYNALHAGGKTYTEIDYFANLYFGDGNMQAFRTPANAISDPVAGEPGKWHPEGGAQPTGTYKKGATYGVLNAHGFVYEEG